MFWPEALWIAPACSPLLLLLPLHIHRIKYPAFPLHKGWYPNPSPVLSQKLSAPRQSPAVSPHPLSPVHNQYPPPSLRHTRYSPPYRQKAPLSHSTWQPAPRLPLHTGKTHSNRPVPIFFPLKPGIPHSPSLRLAKSSWKYWDNSGVLPVPPLSGRYLSFSLSSGRCAKVSCDILPAPHDTSPPRFPHHISFPSTL